MMMMMMMMKAFLFLSLCLIKGHVGDDAFTVTGITGGSVIINWKYEAGAKENAKSFCKISGTKCTTLTELTDHLWIPEQKFSMIDNKTICFISVLIRNLTANDRGTYRCQSCSKSLQKVKLDVEEKAWFGRFEQTAYALGTAVIRCGYPEAFHHYPKQLFKVHNGSLQGIFTYRNENKDARFSLNMDSQDEHVFTVTVTKASRHDDGVYFCGASQLLNPINHSVLFTEIQLHVTDLHIIVAVSVCVILMFAGGLILLLKWRCKKTDVSDDQRNSRDGDEITPYASYATVQDSGNTALHSSTHKPIGLRTVYATIDPMTENTTQS